MPGIGRARLRVARASVRRGRSDATTRSTRRSTGRAARRLGARRGARSAPPRALRRELRSFRRAVAIMNGGSTRSGLVERIAAAKHVGDTSRRLRRLAWRRSAHQAELAPSVGASAMCAGTARRRARREPPRATRRSAAPPPCPRPRSRHRRWSGTAGPTRCSAAAQLRRRRRRRAADGRRARARGGVAAGGAPPRARRRGRPPAAAPSRVPIARRRPPSRRPQISCRAPPRCSRQSRCCVGHRRWRARARDASLVCRGFGGAPRERRPRRSRKRRGRAAPRRAVAVAEQRERALRPRSAPMERRSLGGKRRLKRLPARLRSAENTDHGVCAGSARARSSGVSRQSCGGGGGAGGGDNSDDGEQSRKIAVHPVCLPGQIWRVSCRRHGEGASAPRWRCRERTPRPRQRLAGLAAPCVHTAHPRVEV